MEKKYARHPCALVVIADGFDELETIVILSALREAGIHTKSVGLTSGLIGGAHGIWMLPDCTLADISRTIDLDHIGLVVLPGGDQNILRMEPDPRVHRVVRHVLAREGLVATNRRGSRVLQAATGADVNPRALTDRQVVLRGGAEQSVIAFAQELVDKLARNTVQRAV